MNTSDQLNIDDFEIIHRVGSGSFSEVFIVKDKKTGNLYAAKVPLKPIYDYENGEMKDISREFSIMSKLNHPSILKMTGYSLKSFHSDDKPTIFTKYLPNGTLSQIIAAERNNKQPEGWDDTAKLIALYGIASAMKYLHSNNVIHRDLKPTNILLDDELHPKIGDFGLSKIIKSNESSIKQSTINTKGTPIYMPPELWEKNAYSSAGDVYAFGIIVYEMITSQEPYCSYKNINPNKLSKLVMEGIRPNMDFPIPDSYKELIESCWHQEPTARPTFEEIVEVLRNNKAFITENIDEDKYLQYIKYIDNYDVTFDSEKHISYEDFEKLKSNINKNTSQSSFIKITNDKFDADDFEMVRRIGSGTFAEVFIVKEKKTGKLYAAKVPLRPINDYKKEEIKDISREFTIQCKLNHPAILKMVGYCLNSFYSDDKPTIITEYISNGTLVSIIQSERRGICSEGWDDTAKLIALYGIASAMKYLHSNNVIHRDLKPANILMDEQLHPKIGDFGISKITHANNENKESTVSLKGTPIYIPPELWEENTYSFAGDVYAFGIIVYEVITSQEPYSNYKGINDRKLSKLVMEGIRPNMDFPIPDSYKELIESCWHQEPTARPTFEEIVDVLRNNKAFITENIDEDKYLQYIKYIDDYDTTFNSEKENISFKKFDESNINPDDENAGLYYFEIAEKYYKGDEVTVDRAKAAQNYKLAAEKNHLEAMFNYGNMLFNGDGIEQNQQKGVEYILKASNGGHIDAMYIYASMLENGKGVAVDMTAAANLYLKAAKQGHPEAQFAYAKMLETGIGVSINKYKSFEYFKIAANNDHTEAIFNYGLGLYNGFGTTVNLKDCS